MSYCMTDTCKLRKLVLEGNNIDDALVSALLSQVHILESLSILSLGVNAISDKGMRVICEILGKNKSLKEFYLHANRGITDGSYHMLVDALKSNTTLETLDLRGTNIGIQCSFDLKVKFRNKSILCSPEFRNGEHESFHLNLDELFV